MVRTKPFFYVSKDERGHIISALIGGLSGPNGRRHEVSLTYELFVVLHKLAQLKKELRAVERTDSSKFKDLRKRMLQVRNTAHKLLNSEDVSKEDMCSVVRRLTAIESQLKEVSKDLCYSNISVSQECKRRASTESATSVSVSSDSPKVKCKRTLKDKKRKARRSKAHLRRNMCLGSQPPKTSFAEFVSKCASRSFSFTVSSSGGSSCQNQSKSITNEYRSNKYYFPQSKFDVSNKHLSNVKYSKSSHVHSKSQYRKKDVPRKVAVKVRRRWSTPSVSMKFDNNYNGQQFNTRSKDINRYYDGNVGYIRLPGMGTSEKEQLYLIRKKILKDSSWNLGVEAENCKPTKRCCVHSKAAIDVFETSSINLKHINAAPNAKKCLGKEATFYGMTKSDGLSSKAIAPRKQSEGKDTDEFAIATEANRVDMVERSTQTDYSKVSQSTSYDNFILHPRFSWDIPIIGQAFKQRIPLNEEGKTALDGGGHIQRPRKESRTVSTRTKKQTSVSKKDGSAQTNEALFTDDMQQVVHLNVVYTKTHLRYIVPGSVKIPVLSHSPQVIERRSIDNGYAVTTYKVDPNGEIHFTLAYSDDMKKRPGSGGGLSAEAEKRLCQLKELWISSGRKFLAQLSEKLGLAPTTGNEGMISFGTDLSSIGSDPTTASCSCSECQTSSSQTV